MGGQSAEEVQRKIQEKVENFNKLIDTAYELFDGKYSVDQIATMPYKILIEKLDREQEIYARRAQAKAARELGR